MKRGSFNWYELRHEILLIATVACAIALTWHAIRQHDRAHAHRITAVAATGIRADFEADMRERLRAQLRLGHTLRLTEELARQDWEASARLYVEHYPGSLLLEQVDSTYRAVRRFPRDQQATADLAHTVGDAERGRVIELVRRTRAPALSHAITLPGGNNALLSAVPVFDNGAVVGYVLNTVDISAALSAMLQDVSDLGYDYAIFEGKEQVFSPGRYPTTYGDKDEVQVSLPPTGWTLRVRPQPAMLAATTSRFPEILASTIAALGFALVMAVRFAKGARREKESAQSAKDAMASEVVERRRMEEAARSSEAKFAAILDISADAIISTDAEQNIILFNQGAEKIFGYRAEEVLGQPLDLLLPEAYRQSHRKHVVQFAAGDPATLRMCNRRPVAGRRKHGTDFPAEATVSKIEIQGQMMFTVILRDISERVAIEKALVRSRDELELHVQQRTAELAAANDALRELSGRLLALQEEERRRIARELHDSTSSTLVLALIHLSKLQDPGSLPADSAAALSEGMRGIEQAISELRTVSYRLHPPMLEEFGLSFALPWYINGFRERSGVRIEVAVDANLGRLSSEVELTIFRIVQEALANVHRHAHADAASVAVHRDSNSIRLEVADNGRGIPQEWGPDQWQHFGVGIAGMRERVRQLGGTFDLRSGGEGTTVVASFPMSSDESAAA